MIIAVAKTALLSRLLVLSLQLLTTFLADYDTSSCGFSRQINGSCTRDAATLSILTFSVKWDAEYFASIAEYGYQYEQTMAFFPFLPKATQFISTTVFRPIQSLLRLSARESILLSSIFLNNFVFFPLAAVFLYRLSEDVLCRKSTAFRSVLLFCCNPASVFMSVMYTEASFAALSFLAMSSMMRRSYWLATVAVSLTCAMRSNGLLNAGLLGYFLLVDILRAEKRQLISILRQGSFAALMCVLSIVPFFAYQYYGYYLMCSDGGFHEGRPWCSWTLPLPYSFIQKHYWNVGFLQYFELKQIPNFLLALPVFCMIIGCTVEFIKKMFPSLKAVGFLKFALSQHRGLWSSLSFPYVAHLAFIGVFGMTSMHAQVLTRFCFSSSPAIYWYAAHLTEPTNGKSSTAKAVVTYFVTYCLLGILVHCTFYPWT
eukprot:m.41213 g.41213  ORF g.41213 m.41213 type:complete len:428 (+) comp33108_c0_seq1:2-1285(+)